MQSRKKKNLEVERRVKAQKKLHAGVFAAIVLAVLIAVAWLVWDAQNRRFIMTFDGERISTGDFRFVGHVLALRQDPGAPGFNRFQVLDELISLLAVIDMGEEYADGFTQEEREIGLDMAVSHRQWMQEMNYSLGYIGNERMAELLGIMELWHVVPRIVEEFVERGYYVLDEEEFAEELTLHIERLIEEGTEVYVKYMATYERDGFNEAALELVSEDGFDFDDLISRFSVLETGHEPINLTEFLAQYGIWQTWNLEGLPIGQFSSTLEGSEYFFIAYIYDRVEPELDLEEVEEDFRESFLFSRSFGIFIERLEERVEYAHEQLANPENARFRLNQRVFDSF